jgi:tetratricopeptide (TPR) repeat protein
MAAGQQASEPLDVLEFGENILEIDPDHLGALLTLPPVILDNIPEFGRARETNLSRAFELANRARLRAQSAYPEGGNAQRALERSQVFSRIFLYLGQVHELRGDDERAAGEYARILTYDPESSEAYLRIGLAYQRLGAADSDVLAQAGDQETPSDTLEQNVIANLDLAIDNLISAVALGGVAADLARVELEGLYEARGDDVEALDALIEARREQLTETP